MTRTFWIILAICWKILFIAPYHTCIEPVSTTAGLVAAGSVIYYYTKCKYIECCQEPWVRTSLRVMDELQHNLTQQLYGQPFAKDIVFRAVKSHVIDDNPKKALVMSFHGGPGTGKNHVSEIIARALFKEGTSSNYFVKISAVDKFSEKDPESKKKYRADLKNLVKRKLRECGRCLFVIDEVDKMPDEILDILTPFFDYSAASDVDARRSIFLFLSNTGSTGISQIMYKFWLDGKQRNDLVRRDMESMINRDSFNEQGGFRGSDIMARNLIDHYIPFLPLERKHIRLCIHDYIQLKYGSRIPRREKIGDFIEKVAEEIEYFPRDSQVYARTGCKRISAKVDVSWND